MIELKSKKDIEIIAEGGKLLSGVMELLYKAVKPGVTTKELDRLAEDAIRKHGIPSFKNYNGFPATLCTSVNEQVVHGIPCSRRLNEGDIIGIDVGMLYKGFHTDMARTFAVGEISKESQKLIDVTRQSFFDGLEFAKIGNRIGDISCAIQKTAEKSGYGVVRELCGHGVGRKLHEEPEVPNFGKSGHGARISEGLVIAIEPMINMGTKDVCVLEDDWTVVTRDGKYSAHYENTIAVTQNGPIALTNFEVK